MYLASMLAAIQSNQTHRLATRHREYGILPATQLMVILKYPVLIPFFVAGIQEISYAR